MSRARLSLWTKFVGFIALVAMIVPLLAACAPAPAPAAQPAAPAATQAPAAKASEPTKAPAAAPAAAKKVLKMARNAEPFSPFIPWQMDDNPAIFISVNIYDTLLRNSADSKSIEPGLAEKYEASADGLTWTLKIRDGIKFSDGTPLKMDDIKASIEMCAKGEKSAWKASYKAIKEVQIVDDKTVKVVLSELYPALPSALAMFSAAIIPADLAKASDAKDFDVTTAWKTRGTGAYYVESWKKGDPIIMKRNPNYWKGKSDVEEVRVEYIPDDNTRILKLQGGEADVIDFVPLSQLQTVGTQPNIKAQPFTIAQMTFLMLNNEYEPLKDAKVRQAINYATDKDAIVKVVYFGQAKSANAPIPPGMYQAADLPGYKFDLEKAKALMKESKSPNGFTLDMQVRSGNADFANVATIVKDQWAKIGINVNIQNLETSVVRTNYREGKYQAMPSAWTNDMNDPTQIVNYEMRGGPNTQFAYWTRYYNQALNDKITKADLEMDAKKREVLYNEIQKQFQEDAPIVWLAYTPATAAWNSSKVEGFLIEGLSYYRFENVKLK